MIETPLYTALCAFAETRPARWHMPGHHGRELPVPELAGYARLDFTELPATGDLFSPGGAIEEAEALWARDFGFGSCLFLTGGSTQGILSALTLAAAPGGAVLMDRGCHRSAFNAMALLDLRPVFLARPWLDRPGVSGPIDPQVVEKLLKERPEVKTVCITSPTYYGVLSDVAAISAVVHAHGGKLVVDGAHGAHLPFLGEAPYRGADLVVVSAHKTLPAPGQTALLFGGEGYGLEDLRRAGKIYGSSSPSYPMMAALDVCRAYMEGEGAAAYARTAEQVRAFRARFASLREADAPLDPSRFVWQVPDGHAAKAALEARGIFPEMADAAHVVFIATSCDKDKDFTVLSDAMESVCPSGGAAPAPYCPPCPAFPEQVLPPRAALFAQRRFLPLREAEGLISAEQVAPYPPGVPVIAPGERVEKKHLSYLEEVGYNMNHIIGVL